MPFWRTTANIFTDLGEYFDENWMNSNTLITPPQTPWDYKREMKIEDVNLWEELRFNHTGIGVWAAWDPYAEFYMITHRMGALETFYGPAAAKKVYKRAKELGVDLVLHTLWVENDEMWLQVPSTESASTILLQKHKTKQY